MTAANELPAVLMHDLDWSSPACGREKAQRYHQDIHARAPFSAVCRAWYMPRAKRSGPHCEMRANDA